MITPSSSFNRLLKTITVAGCISVTPMLTHAAPGPVSITFVELNDLHANLVPHKDLVSNPDGSTSVTMKGGMARMKTIINQIEAQNPNTIVMNVGDTFHGGVEAFYSLGNAVADPLNAMGIDVGVPGNWDYYFTPAITRARYGRAEEPIVMADLPGVADPVPVKRPAFPNLGANVRDITDPLPEDFLPPTYMIEQQGVKVGFIGFTSDIVELMHPMLAEGMDFAWGIDEHLQLLLKYSQQLRDQGADVVVVMSELGIHKDIALSKALAQKQANGEIAAGLIDVFFSAHTHEVTRQPVSATKDGSALYAPVVESGNDGYLGRMDVTMNYVSTTTTGRLFNQVEEQNWSLASMHWQLIAVDDSVAEDPAMKALVDAQRAPFLDDQVNIRALPFVMQRLQQPIDTVIGHLAPGSIMQQKDGLAGVLSRNHSLSSPFNQALTRMMRDITGSDVAMTPGFRMGATVPEAGFALENGGVASGDITLEDAYRFFPMYYGLAVASTSGQHLKDVINHTLDATYSSDTWNTQGGWNYGYAGVDITVDLDAGDQRRVIGLHRSDNGAAIQDSDVISIAGCRRLPIDFNGTLCGIGGFDNVTTISNPSTGLPWSLVDMFTHMLQDTGYALSTPGSNVTDVSNTAMWPDSEYIQPLEGVGEFFIPQDQTDPCGFFKWNCLNL